MMTPPENKSDIPRQEFTPRMGTCEGCQHSDKLMLYPTLVHGELYWLCDVCSKAGIPVEKGD